MENTEQSSEVTGITYRYLQTRCAASGVSLTKVCELAGVQMQQVQTWKKRDPKSIETLRKLEAVLFYKERKARAERVWELTQKA